MSKDAILRSLTPWEKILFFLTFSGLVHFKSGWVDLRFNYGGGPKYGYRYICVVHGGAAEDWIGPRDLTELPDVPPEMIHRIEVCFCVSYEEGVSQTFKTVTLSTIEETKQLVAAFEKDGVEGTAPWSGEEKRISLLGPSGDYLPEYCCEYHEREAAEEEDHDVFCLY